MRGSVRRRVPWWGWVLGAAVLAVGGVAALGGFNDVPVQKLPVIELGQTYSTNAIDVTVLSVELRDIPPFRDFPTDGREYVTVVVEATATGDEPSTFARDLIAVLLEGLISPDDRSTYATVKEMRNGDVFTILQPNLPTRLAYTWEIPAGSAHVGDQIVVGIFEQHAVPDSPVFEDMKVAVPIVRIITTLEAAS